MEIYNIDILNNNCSYNEGFRFKIYLNCSRNFNSEDQIVLAFKYIYGSQDNYLEKINIPELINGDNSFEVNIDTLNNLEEINEESHCLMIGIFYKKEKLINKISYFITYEKHENNIIRIWNETPAVTKCDIECYNNKKIYNDLFQKDFKQNYNDALKNLEKYNKFEYDQPILNINKNILLPDFEIKNIFYNNVLN